MRRRDLPIRRASPPPSAAAAARRARALGAGAADRARAASIATSSPISSPTSSAPSPTPRSSSASTLAATATRCSPRSCWRPGSTGAGRCRRACARHCCCGSSGSRVHLSDLLRLLAVAGRADQELLAAARGHGSSRPSSRRPCARRSTPRSSSLEGDALRVPARAPARGPLRRPAARRAGGAASRPGGGAGADRRRASRARPGRRPRSPITTTPPAISRGPLRAALEAATAVRKLHAYGEAAVAARSGARAVAAGRGRPRSSAGIDHGELLHARRPGPLPGRRGRDRRGAL